VLAARQQHIDHKGRCGVWLASSNGQSIWPVALPETTATLVPLARAALPLQKLLLRWLLSA
jgi:hypothetical protein